MFSLLRMSQVFIGFISLGCSDSGPSFCSRLNLHRLLLTRSLGEGDHVSTRLY